MKKFFYLSLLFFYYSISFAKSYDSLISDVERIKGLFQTNPDFAFSESILFISKAKKSRDMESLLSISAMQCWYLYRKSDHERLYQVSKNLLLNARNYGSKRHEAIAHIYLSQVYTVNELYEKAIDEYDKAILIFDKHGDSDSSFVFTRRNAHTYISNTYLKMDRPEVAVQKLLLAIGEYKNIPKNENIMEYKFLDYSNLAAAYLHFNLDSAEYYVLRSIENKPEIAWQHNMFLNYSVLGDIHKKRKNFDVALYYYDLAENFDFKYTDLPNLEVLYREILSIYTEINDYVNVEKYGLKLKDVQLQIAENKYKSIHQILKSKEENENNIPLKNFIIPSIIIIFVTLIFFLLLKYYRTKNKYNNISDIVRTNTAIHTNLYSDIVNMAMSNDPAFISTFFQVFPDFSKNLLKINPNLVQTEIEFCMYLKLNFSTKEIATFKSIQPRSVQNKKHRIRKRLKIEENVDIYYWFNYFT